MRLTIISAVLWQQKQYQQLKAATKGVCLYDDNSNKKIGRKKKTNEGEQNKSTVTTTSNIIVISVTSVKACEELSNKSVIGAWLMFCFSLWVNRTNKTWKTGSSKQANRFHHKRTFFPKLKKSLWCCCSYSPYACLLLLLLHCCCHNDVK